MHLIKYRDEMNGEQFYSYFWVHDFGDGVEKIVSDIFETSEAATNWAKTLKENSMEKHTKDVK